jgi:hypothetical protein
MPPAPKSRAFRVLSAAVAAGVGCRLLSLRSEFGPIVFEVPESIAAQIFDAPRAPRTGPARVGYHRANSEERTRIYAAVASWRQGGRKASAFAHELGISPAKFWYYCRKLGTRNPEPETSASRRLVTKPNGRLL